MKRPSFQFYPADWQKDPALQSCSIAARGLWIELMCIAHQAEPYGFISINSKPATLPQVSRLVGESEKSVAALMDELEGAGVFSRDEQGRSFSRRMVRDEALRNVRVESGRLGGNPVLVKQKVKRIDNHATKENLTPSSSSSSSTSVVAKTAIQKLIELGVEEKVASDWLVVRKAKRAPLTDTVLEDLQREAKKAGITVNQAVFICAKRSWQGFNASWEWKDSVSNAVPKSPNWS